MIQVKSDGTREILNVTSGGQPVLAGSMFITQECKSAKPKPSTGNNNNIVSGGTRPSGNTGAGSSGLGAPEEGKSTSSVATGIRGLLTYAHVLMAAIVIFIMV